MLAAEVRYLTGRVVSADVTAGNQKDAVEWPPHPARFQMALVAAWGDGGEDGAEREAVEWLESLEPPLIVCGEATPRVGGSGDSMLSGQPVTTYVPVNDPFGTGTRLRGGDPVEDRTRKERAFPSASVWPEVVRFLWPTARLTPERRAALDALARRTSCLGHSSSLVGVRWLDHASDHATWRPGVEHADEVRALRVPYPGRLSELVARHAEGRRPAGGRVVRYGRQPDAVDRADEPARGVFGELVVLRRVEGDRLSARAAHGVAATLRAALMAHGPQPTPSWLGGHEPGERSGPASTPHVGFVALPDVGHPHAGGHLLGCAILLPRALDAGQRRQALVTLGHIEELVFRDGRRWRVEPVGPDAALAGLQRSTWTRSSRTWGSVTPVVLDRYPEEPFGDEAAAIVRRACVFAGLPEPDGVELGPVSWVAGAPPARDFAPMPGKPGRPARWHLHVRLRFDQLVAGPMAIGAGRYQGFGLCRPLAEGR